MPDAHWETFRQPRAAAGYFPPTESPKSHCVSWRMDADEYARLQPFFAAFPDRRMATGMRWLMDHPDVRKIMADKMREGIS